MPLETYRKKRDFGRTPEPDALESTVQATTERLQARLGGTPPERVVTYCGSGVAAAQGALAMEVAGLPGARIYPGSWSEWSADPTRPIATGPE